MINRYIKPVAIENSDQIKFFEMPEIWQRVLLISLAILALIFTWFIARWSIGNTIAETAIDLEGAKVALKLAPSDPQAHYMAAVRGAETMLPEELQESLKHYELAVAHSPHDYRLWMELGRARGQMGDKQGAEQALRHAIQLAPSYARPRWFLGNHLLRDERVDEAFRELRFAGEADPDLLLQVFNLARRFYGEDIATVTKMAGSSSKAFSQLVEYLTKQNRLDEALYVWSNINEQDRRDKEQRFIGEALMKKLFDQRRFHAGVDVYNGFIPEDEAKILKNTLYNGSFEIDIAVAGVSQFGWQINSVSQAQIRIDALMGHSGKRSLRINLSAPQALDLKNVSQFILVEPSTRYKLQFYVRTEELKGASTPTIEVIDNGAEKKTDNAGRPINILATSEPVPMGTNDWKLIELEFTTPANTEAVTLQLSRSECVTDVCPIFGKIWYDDFNLQRLGQGTAAGSNESSANSSNIQ